MNITGVAFSGGPDNYTLTINSAGFGNLPASVPFNGVTRYFRLFEVAQLGAGEWGYSLQRRWNRPVLHLLFSGPIIRFYFSSGMIRLAPFFSSAE